MAEENFEEMIMDMEETSALEDVEEEDYSDPLTGHIVQFVTDTYSKAETARQIDEERRIQAYRNTRDIHGPNVKFTSQEKIIEFEKTKSNIKKYYSKKDSENIKICKELSIAEWNDLWAWCRETNKVDTELSNLCLSFLSMAEKKMGK